MSRAPLLSPRLQALLSRSRLRPRTARPLGGQGDRSSAAKGSGLEFAEHRPYQPGDDLRHVDPHLEARLGETYIREYSLDQQLPVTLVLDVSASMAAGEPSRLDRARELAAALAFLALAASDRVRLAAVQNGRVLFTEWFSGARNAERVYAWLSALEPAGRSDLSAAAPEIASKLPAAGQVFIFSDWYDQNPERLPLLLGGEGREVLAVHLYAPADADPTLLSASGDVRLMDAETGEELEVALTEQALREYRDAWEEFRNALRDGLQSRQALYLPVRLDRSVGDVLLRDWTGRGLILR